LREIETAQDVGEIPVYKLGLIKKEELAGCHITKLGRVGVLRESVQESPSSSTTDGRV
jgi:hypothetical protein